MASTIVLKISLCEPSSAHPFAPGEVVWNEHRGGPTTLLRWLETQLGLLRDTIPLSSRVMEFADVLAAGGGDGYRESLKTDRWATATELLSRRDELRMAGWEDDEMSGLPPVVSDLAAALENRAITWPDTAARLKRVLDALDDGQRLPAHRLLLDEPVAAWPVRWQLVLKRLSPTTTEDPAPLGNAGSALRAAQLGIALGQANDLEIGPSLRWVSSCSVLSACELVATVLAADTARLADTVVFCEDSSVAVCLDGCLNRMGLPTMGAAEESLSHPAFQVLPLVLNLMWEPVDPELVLAFLSLPVNPLPRFATWRLAEALSQQPGLGSRSWEAAFNKLCEEDEDPDKRLQSRLALWLHGTRYPKGTTIPATAVKDVCGQVAQWATGYATLYSEKEDIPSSLVDALRSVAGQASTLGQLAETHGGALSEPQIGRLRDAAMSFGGRMEPFPMRAGGPRLVTSLADLRTPCSHLIWLGLATKERANCRWSTMELSRLHSAGIAVDDGRVAVTTLRNAERRGFCNVTGALLAISLPGDAEQKLHPFWVQICRSLPKPNGERAKPVLLEDLLSGHSQAAIAPWSFETTMFEPKPCQPPRVHWDVPAGLLRDREQSSASELIDRLACPLKWVLNYQARIAPSAIASLPESFLLMGTFCHSILQSVFGSGGPLPSADVAAEAVRAAFDSRLPLDAAPLAQPMKIVERQQVRDSLCNATRVLVNALHSGGYRIAGIEVEVTGQVLGRTLVGSIDCLAVRDDGREAVIDFKFGGRSKYTSLIMEGRAVQLATYAYGRAQQTADGRFPAVAYLVIKDARLIFGDQDRLLGNTSPVGVPEAGIAETWKRFEDSLGALEQWLTDGAAVPARPLQQPSQWPAGVELVLRGPSQSGSGNDDEEVCKYCHYPALCGKKELI